MKKTITIKKKFLKYNYYLAVLILILIPSFFIFIQNSINIIDLSRDFPINDDPQIKSNPINSLDPDDFLYYKDIIIDDSKITGELNNFPLLFLIHDEHLQDFAHPDGYDIVFYSINDSQWCEHEIEKYTQFYDGSYAELMAWVKVPTLYENDQTVIRMYFGNPSIVASEENPNNLWDSYRGVWHLSEDPSDSGKVIKDSTSPEFNGDPGSTMTTTDLIDGYIGKAIDFDGNDDYIDFGDYYNGGYYDTSNSITVSFWMKPGDVKYMIPIDKFPIETLIYPYDHGWRVLLTQYGQIGFCLGNTNFGISRTAYTSNNKYTENEWVYITCTFGSGNINVYVNGINEAYNSYGLTITDNYNTNLRFGEPDEVDTGARFEGTIDEVHISNNVRSGDWILTEYANQQDPESFYTIGSLEGPGVNAPNIIIDSPLDSSIYNPPSLTITATITDDTFVNDATATITGGSTPVAITMSQVSLNMWECVWDFSSLSFPAQDYTITITAHDSEGYTGSSESVTVTIQKDLTPPNIIFVSPNDGTSVGDPFTITATITDSAGNDPGDDDVFATIKYGGDTLFNLILDRIGGTNNWTAEWSNITLPDYQLGDYTIDITAIDTSYYRNEQTTGSRTITLIDIHAPIVIIESMYSGPYGQYQTYEELELKATITDSKSTVEQVIAIISGPETLNIAMNFNGDKWTCLWDNITAYTNGNYKITIWAIDEAGNINQQESVIVSINNLQYAASGDNGAPYLLIIGIIAFVGSVGSIGTYGMIRVKRNRNNAPNLDDKLLKLQKGIKKTEMSLKQAKSYIKESSIPQEDDIVREIKNIQQSSKKQRNLPISQSKSPKRISKIRIQDEIMNLELNDKKSDEKLKIMKKPSKDIEDLY